LILKNDKFLVMAVILGIGLTLRQPFILNFNLQVTSTVEIQFAGYGQFFVLQIIITCERWLANLADIVFPIGWLQYPTWSRWSAHPGDGQHTEKHNHYRHSYGYYQV
jgi:hypothetical protein